MYYPIIGTNRQFEKHTLENLKTEQFKFAQFDRILELWTDRVNPTQIINRCKASRNLADAEKKRDEEKAAKVVKDGGAAGEILTGTFATLSPTIETIDR